MPNNLRQALLARNRGSRTGAGGLTSYMPVAITETFAQLMARLSGEKPGVEQAHNALLAERYDLSDRPAQGVTMDRTCISAPKEDPTSKLAQSIERFLAHAEDFPRVSINDHPANALQPPQTG
jgi:hypothetical protein